MTPELLAIIQWLVPATFLGSLAFVMLDPAITKLRHVLGMLLYSTLASSAIGVAVFAWLLDTTGAMLAGLTAALSGPKVYGSVLRRLAQKHLKLESSDTDDPPKPWR